MVLQPTSCAWARAQRAPVATGRLCRFGSWNTSTLRDHRRTRVEKQ
jgi:hypothetical protein